MSVVISSSSLIGCELNFNAVKVLLLERDPNLRRVLSLGLRTRGLQVLEVALMQDAFAVAEFLVPDVIICAIALQDGDGLTFIKRWRHREGELGMAPIPAVAITGHAQPDVPTQALQGGFQRCLIHPFGVQTLERVVTELVQSSR